MSYYKIVVIDILFVNITLSIYNDIKLDHVKPKG